ncbi:helix-turn-helix transcriptional regulator [Nonomuraea sp. NPDC050643]|uniref:helix-turn-helix domain-containing protein n=1 Tax=Nonomuraea sp. NPDC050643 TaxID=3155660 RepID=UPI0033F52FE5
MDPRELGRRLRGRRAALGRTVATVAADAGLSVPYVANLENGRGNPTVSALDRLAEALGTRLVITLADQAPEPPPAPPPSLPEFARGRRFRRAAGTLAGLLGEDDATVRATLVNALAAVATPLRRDLSEADWERLLDALVLILGHPAGER